MKRSKIIEMAMMFSMVAWIVIPALDGPVLYFKAWLAIGSLCSSISILYFAASIPVELRPLSALHR